MGYYTKYLSTLLRGPWATTIKERFESRRAINNLRASDKKLYKELPKLVEQEHKVTKALKEEDKVIRELKEAAADGYALAFNVSTMDMKILEAVNKLIEVWTRIHALTRNVPSKDNLSQELERLKGVCKPLLLVKMVILFREHFLPIFIRIMGILFGNTRLFRRRTEVLRFR